MSWYPMDYCFVRAMQNDWYSLVQKYVAQIGVGIAYNILTD